ncbi:MAG: hypothetical protein R3249_09630 [Nitriliruptorales bacterium]|nr:hypothetical protein [Nitriliruptorales bacterium]
MDELRGTGRLVAFVFRLERRAFAIWVGVLGLMPALVASSFEAIYPTEAAVREAAEAVTSNTAFAALLGRVQSPTIGGLTAWRIGTVAALFVAIFSALTVIRHTRAEEEIGRGDLVRSMAVGRRAPLAAAVLATLLANAAIALVATLGLLALGQPTPGAVALGLAFGLTGWAFTGIGAVAAQLTDGARAARTIAMGVVGIAFLARMLGDTVDGVAWASWISPIGWVQRLRPFAGEDWWVVALPVAVTLAGLGAAAALAARRDTGAGVFATRPGPARASESLRTPAALAWRLQRGLVLAWAIGMAVFGAVIGGIAPGMEDLVGGSEQMREILERLGGPGALVDAFLAGSMGNLAIAGAAFAVLAMLRLRSEEAAQQAEMILATTVSRSRWLSSHAAISFLGSALLMVVAGLAAGLTFGIGNGQGPGEVTSLVGAALVQVPAIWTLAAVALLLVGWLPEHSSWSWGVLAGTFLVTLLGAILGLGQAVLNLSVFQHTPQLPVADLAVLPLAILAALAAVLAITGRRGLLVRDLG